MARLNKRQLKKAHKKRIDQLFKDYNKELVCELLTNQLRMVEVIEGPDEIFVSEEALKLIIEHSKRNLISTHGKKLGDQLREHLVLMDIILEPIGNLMLQKIILR